MIKRFVSETTDCDFKAHVEHSRPKSWLKSVSAFANTIGGTVVFGIDDSTHEAIGIDNPQAEIEFISRMIHDRIDPIPHFEIALSGERAGAVIELRVPAGTHPPHYYRADGRREAYVRNGDRSELISSEHLNELILKGTNQTWDSLVSGISMDRASFTVLRAGYALRTGHDIDDADLISFGLVTDDGGYLTNAGALLADEPLIRHSRLFCTRWTGTRKEDPTDDGEFSGSLLTLLREGEAFVKRHNILSWKKTPNSRINLRCYSERAITEALVNALVHRSYLDLGSEVHIDMYDDRVDVISPGSMMKGPLPKDVMSTHVESHRRNPIVCDIFSRMNLMERRGTGLREICSATAAEDGYRSEFKPLFENGPHDFYVTLWNMKFERTPQVAPQVAPQVERLLRVMGNETLSLSDIMGRMGLSDKKNFRESYLVPALRSAVIEMTIPDKPNSSLQKYRRTHEA